MMITITSPEFTIEGMRHNWADDAALTAAQVNGCADAEYAFYVLNTHEAIRGWTFGLAGFTGPMNKDAITLIASLQVDAADYVIANLDEIKADATA